MAIPPSISRYKWGINDRLSEILDSVTGKASFTHDERGYLTGAKYDGGQTQLRNPDAVGNLFETADRSDRKYGNGGRLLKKGATTYEYDLEGNLSAKKTPKGTWHYEWNAAGMLSKVIRPDKEEVTFAYDALGRRIWKKFKKTITNFAWDGNVPLHEWKTFDFKEGSADDLITWFFESDGFVPCSKLKGDKQYSICADHLGTPSRVYDAEGGLVWHMELDSYGRERVLKGDLGACPFRYQGQYVDAETGLYYNRFRYFDPEDGRYVTQDPIGLGSGEFGLYNFVVDANYLVDLLGLTSYKSDPKKKVNSGNVGDDFRTPKSHPEDFVSKGKNKTNIHTGEIWQRSHTQHSGGEEWKVGRGKGVEPRKTKKVTLTDGGEIIKFD